MKTFHAVISHSFRVFLLFLLAFIWIRFYERNLLLATLYSGIVCLSADIFISILTRKSQESSNLKQAERKRAQDIASHFILAPKSESVSFFHKLLANTFDAQKKTNYLWWNSPNGTIVLYPYFVFDTVKIRDLFTIYNNIKTPAKPSKIIICTASFDKETIEFVKASPVKFVLMDQFDIYEKLMKPQNTFPKHINPIQYSKPSTWTNIMTYALNRKRTKVWIFSAVLLTLSSFFVRVSIYYLIISSVLLILGIFSFVNTKYNTKHVENIF